MSELSYGPKIGRIYELTIDIEVYLAARKVITGGGEHGGGR